MVGAASEWYFLMGLNNLLIGTATYILIMGIGLTAAYIAERLNQR